MFLNDSMFQVADSEVRSDFPGNTSSIDHSDFRTSVFRENGSSGGGLHSTHRKARRIPPFCATVPCADGGSSGFSRSEVEVYPESTPVPPTLNEQAFQMLFAGSPIPMFVLDEKTLQILEINKSACLTYGYPHEEFLCLSLWNLYPAAEEQILMKDWDAFGEKTVHAREVGQILKNGTVMDARITSQPLEFNGREARLSMVEDITERNALREAVTENEERLRLAVTGAGLGTLHWNLRTGEMVWSDLFRRIFGFGENEAESLDALKLAIHPDDRNRVEAGLSRASEGGEPFGIEFRLVSGRTGEKLRHVAWSGKAYLDRSGRPSRVESVVADITRQKGDAAKARLLESAIENATDVVVITEAGPIGETGPRIVYANSAFGRMAGTSPEELIGGKPRFLQLGGTESKEARARVLLAMNRSESVTVEIQNSRKDGVEFWSDLAIVPVFDENGEITNFLAIQRDVTERRGKEGQFRDMQKMEAIGQLTTGIAHNFNNILMIIAGNAALIERTARAIPEIKEKARRIVRAAERGANLVKQLNVFGHGMNLADRVQALNPVLRECLEPVEKDLPHSIRIKTDFTDRSIFLWADRDQLTQAVLVLVFNARDAMPNGGTIRVGTGFQRIDHAPTERSENETIVFATAPISGTYAVITVTDTGEGMSNEVRGRIFEPFFTTRPQGAGIGLGLATLYGFVARQGGFMSIKSKPDQGTEFRMFLPAEAQVETPFVSENRKMTRVDFFGRTALVVDDVAEIRSFICELLSGAGFETFEAPDGPTALRVASENRIHLLITDQVMPGMSGKSLIDRLHREHPNLKCILMSGSLIMDEIFQMTEPIPVGLAKPFSPERLFEAINTLFTPPKNPSR